MQVCPKCGYVTMDNNDKYCPNCIYKAEYENVDDVSKGLKEMYEEDYEDQLLFESFGIKRDNSYVPKTSEEQLAEERTADFLYAGLVEFQVNTKNNTQMPSVALNAVHIQLQQRIGDIVYSRDL